MKSGATAMVSAAVKVIVHIAMHRAAVHGPAMSVPWPINRMRIIRTTVVARADISAVPVRVIPRTHTNEHAVHEVIRSPVTIRRARIRIIGVVTIGADRLNSDGHWADSNPDPYSDLCLCTRRCEKQNSQQSCIF